MGSGAQGMSHAVKPCGGGAEALSARWDITRARTVLSPTSKGVGHADRQHCSDGGCMITRQHCSDGGCMIAERPRFS